MRRFTPPTPRAAPSSPQGSRAHTQDQLGDVVYVELPTVGDELAGGGACGGGGMGAAAPTPPPNLADEFGAVESVKAANELYMPVSGEVVEVNGALEETPSLLNTSPDEEGWILKVRMGDEAELKGLMDAQTYADLCHSPEDDE